MIPAHSYKNSAAYQKNKQLTIETVLYFRDKQLDFATNYLTRQLIRAISSIGANLAEGYGRHYKQDYRRFISIARGSALEVDHWLEILVELNLFSLEKLKKFSESNEEVIKILTVMMKNLEVKKAN